jgi:deoxyribose-phosphate aldolase
VVDHTLLAPEATRPRILELCAQAAELRCHAVCVNGAWVATAKAALAASPVRVCAVVGFPLGAMATAAKSFEARTAVADGADEIDMVMSIGQLKSGDEPLVLADIRSLRAAIPGETILKVILETALLTDDEIRRACLAAKAGGADLVKTSTGFNPAGGATTHAVRLMRQTVGSALGVKASGGIRTLAEAEALLEAGANRLGLSATLSILEEIRSLGRRGPPPAG